MRTEVTTHLCSTRYFPFLSIGRLCRYCIWAKHKKIFFISYIYNLLFYYLKYFSCVNYRVETVNAGPPRITGQLPRYRPYPTWTCENTEETVIIRTRSRCTYKNNTSKKKQEPGGGRPKMPNFYLNF